MPDMSRIKRIKCLYFFQEKKQTKEGWVITTKEKKKEMQQKNFFLSSMEAVYALLASTLSAYAKREEKEPLAPTRDGVIAGLDQWCKLIYENMKNTYVLFQRYSTAPEDMFRAAYAENFASGVTSLDQVRAHRTLVLCLALRQCQTFETTLRGQWVLINIMRVELLQTLPWLATSQPDEDVFYMDIVRDVFPESADRWFGVLFEHVTTRADAILDGFELYDFELDWRATPDRLGAIPTKIISHNEFIVNPKVPPGWKLDKAAALVANVFSPYITYPVAQPMIQAWLERVSPGCSQGYAWTFLNLLAKVNLDLIDPKVPGGNFFNWIRGLWTHATCLHADSRCGEMWMALCFKYATATRNPQTLLCFAVDAFAAAASMDYSFDEEINLSDPIVGDFYLTSAVCEFYSKSSVYGHEYYTMLVCGGNPSRLNMFYTQPSAPEFATLLASWVQKMADIERSYPPTLQFQYIFDSRSSGIWVAMHDSRVYTVCYHSLKNYRLRGDLAAWKELDKEILEILNSPEEMKTPRIGAGHWKDFLPQFLPDDSFLTIMTKKWYPAIV